MKKLIVIFGMMGAGKTTLARALGEDLGLPVVHSDAVRKILAGLTPTTPTPVEFGKGIYDEDFSRRTYVEMRRQAAEHLSQGSSVILDGSYKRAGERELVEQLAREQDAAVIFFFCNAPLGVIKERLGLRAQDPQSISDGREEILEAQLKDFDPVDFSLPEYWGLNTNKSIPDLLEKVKFLLNQRETATQ